MNLLGRATQTLFDGRVLLGAQVRTTCNQSSLQLPNCHELPQAGLNVDGFPRSAIQYMAPFIPYDKKNELALPGELISEREKWDAQAATRSLPAAKGYHARRN